MGVHWNPSLPSVSMLPTETTRIVSRVFFSFKFTSTFSGKFIWYLTLFTISHLVTCQVVEGGRRPINFYDIVTKREPES